MATMRRSIKSLHSQSSLFCVLFSNPTPASLLPQLPLRSKTPPLNFFPQFFSLQYLKKSPLLSPQMTFLATAKATPPLSNRQMISRSLFGSNSRNSGSGGDGPITDSFYRKLDRIEKAHGHGRSSTPGFGHRSRMNDGGSMAEGFDTLSDGMDAKLKRAATTFPVTDEILNDDYAFRPDVTFLPATTYTPRELDLTKPGIQKSFKRAEFETTTAEVLRKADFRNVRFLANFLTEAGIIIKRSQTKISAKAQRKVAREIKTARALGLMPFVTMGTKPFSYGKTMEDVDDDYDYDTYYGGNITDAATEPVEEN